MNKLRSIILAMLLLVWAQGSLASFKQNGKRYISPRDYQLMMQQHFPQVFANHNLEIERGCLQMDINARAILGAVNPALGYPLVAEPSVAFLRHIYGCIQKIVSYEHMIEAKQPVPMARFFPKELLAAGLSPKVQQFSLLSSELKSEWVNQLIDRFIGPGRVVEELGVGSSRQQIVDDVLRFVEEQSGLTLEEANQKLILGVLLREEVYVY